MGNITNLHALAQSYLRDLASKRTMPHGWDHTANRRAEVMLTDLHTYLKPVLEATPNKLMGRLTHARAQELLAIAVEERLLKDMVRRWVELLASEPEVDQQTAGALDHLAEQFAGSVRLLSRIDTLTAELAEARTIVEHCKFSEELDISEVESALSRLRQQALSMQKNIEGHESDLQQDLSSS